MKKPVIIIIALIYILAIVVVGFIGIPARVFNPTTFVSDIELKFDEKLSKVEPGPNEDVDFKFHINSSDEVSFYIRANVLPHESTNQKVTFQKRDDTIGFYTVDVEFKNGYTTATYTCAPLDYDDAKIITIYVRPTDGNKQLVKKIDIVITNW